MSVKWLSALIAACLLLIPASASAVSPTPLAVFSVSGLGSNEYLGYSVATDGQRVLLGTGTNTAFLFDPYTKQQLATLTVPPGSFGTSVALQGNSAVVGTATGTHLFNLSNLASISSLRLTPTDNPSAGMGHSVDMSGDVIIAGANGDATFGDFSGAAYLFNRLTGAQIAKLIPNDSQQYDNFGISVAIDDGRAAVGSVRLGSGQGGSVYLFNAEPGFVGNRQLDKDSQPMPNSFVQFAYNVDLNGQTLVATEAFGQSYIWPIGGTPSPLPQSAFNTRAAADGISLNEDYVALGFGDHGLVRIYDKAGNLLRNLTPPPGSPIGFGVSVAIEGDLLVVGAGGGSPAASRAFVYRVQDVLVPEPTSTALVVVGMTACSLRHRRHH